MAEHEQACTSLTVTPKVSALLFPNISWVEGIPDLSQYLASVAEANLITVTFTNPIFYLC